MIELRVQFLGSGDAFGSGGRFQTCIHVSSDATRFLIDCGASSLVAMKRAGVDPSLIDIVLLSHLHGDHFGGLPFLILDGQFSRRSRPLVLAGAPGLEDRTRQAMEALFPGSSTTQQRLSLEFVEIPDQTTTTIGPLQLTAYTVSHPSGAAAYALRVACEGRVIAYSGDTAWCPGLIAAARGADLFICEAYFFEKEIKYHLDYQTLVRHRSEIECPRIIVTHMSSDMLQRLHEVDVEFAEDGKVVVL
jgi:ribonuclease BN (tRNA processing enzyme)